MAPMIVPQEKGAEVSAEKAEKEHDCKEELKQDSKEVL